MSYTDDFYEARARIRTPERDAAVARLGLTELWEAAHAAEEAVQASKRVETVPAGHPAREMFGDETMEVFDEGALNARDAAWQEYNEALDALREASPEWQSREQI